jgi:hypothetical protein
VPRQNNSGGSASQAGVPERREVAIISLQLPQYGQQQTGSGTLTNPVGPESGGHMRDSAHAALASLANGLFPGQGAGATNSVHVVMAPTSSTGHVPRGRSFNRTASASGTDAGSPTGPLSQPQAPGLAGSGGGGMMERMMAGLSNLAGSVGTRTSLVRHVPTLTATHSQVMVEW